MSYPLKELEIFILQNTADHIHDVLFAPLHPSQQVQPEQERFKSRGRCSLHKAVCYLQVIGVPEDNGRGEDDSKICLASRLTARRDVDI